MLVTLDNKSLVLDAVSKCRYVALDTETTGLRPFHGDYPFCLTLVNDDFAYYWPLAPHGGLEDTVPLDGLSEALKGTCVFIHNAKFDLHMLSVDGVNLHPSTIVHCTMVGSRLSFTGLSSYSLDSCAKYFLGKDKDDKVKAYIDEHGLWDWETIPGVSRRSKRMYFNKVPVEIMIPYALKDAKICYELGCFQLKDIAEKSRWLKENRPNANTLRNVLENERLLTHILFSMEKDGVYVDVEKCREAITSYESLMEAALHDYFKATGVEYKASSKQFSQVFEDAEISTEGFKKTECGNTSFDGDALAKVEHPIADAILRVKDCKSHLNFYNSFLYNADAKSIVHTDFRQQGAKTGRFSSANPNLQNLKRPEDGVPDTSPRQVIKPFPGQCLVAIDYDQMEYRMLVDLAAESDLIEKIRGGLDVHTATSQKVGISRDMAKTLNFAVIYGAGPTLIAEMLNITRMEARELLGTYFGGLPAIDRFIKQVKFVAENRGFTYNWFGRYNYYNTPETRQKTYASTNHLIQGGCADVVRNAMVRCAKVLSGRSSKMILTIHDELVFSVDKTELDIVPQLSHIMSTVYPHRHIPLTASVSYSWSNLATKTKGLPQLEVL